MIIGGEGAFVIGGLAAIAAGLPLLGIAPPLVVQLAMAAAGMAAGAAWIALAGALRHWRGVNETISTPAAHLYRASPSSTSWSRA